MPTTSPATKGRHPDIDLIKHTFFTLALSYEEGAAWLREYGHSFRDSWLRDQIAEIKGRPGKIESADKHRKKATARTMVFTCAQSNTKVHAAFLDSLKRLCEHRHAELHISRFTYNKNAYGQASIKPGAKREKAELWYDEAIQPYVSDESIQVAPDLVWCGEVNVIPTMKFPLTQFKTYTRQDSAIIPHAKMSMESVPTMKGLPAKMLYTTGTITQRNYIQKSTGQIADFHHVFGALYVEVDVDGTWWARQINATNDGCFYELTDYFTPTHVNGERRVAGVTHGDIHWDKRDDDILDVVFNPGGAIDVLHPEEQHFHDSIDFYPRNHHNMKDPWHMHTVLKSGLSNVSGEFVGVGAFLAKTAWRAWSQSYVITSNHDQALEIWLKDTSALMDPVNVTWWHRMNLYCHEMIECGRTPRPFAHALQTAMSKHLRGAYVVILHEDESHLCRGIEIACHGHLGPNGARGSPKNLRTVGKANTAHTHTAGICDGVYTAGLYGKLEMGYNKGLSSWSHSFVITYQNGKRAICTIKDGRAWRDNPRKEDG